MNTSMNNLPLRHHMSCHLNSLNAACATRQRCMWSGRGGNDIKKTIQPEIHRVITFNQMSLEGDDGVQMWRRKPKEPPPPSAPRHHEDIAPFLNLISGLCGLTVRIYTGPTGASS